jgi:hypothetical protein
MLAALLVLGAAVFSADAWRRHGSSMAKLAAEARADLRDALKSEARVVRGYLYDPWPYWWWGHPHWHWWEERRTVIFTAPPPAQPQPAPRRSRTVVVAPAPTVEAAPLPRSWGWGRPVRPRQSPPEASEEEAPVPGTRRIMRELK